MNPINRVSLLFGLLLLGIFLGAQNSPQPASESASASGNLSTVRGCLDGERGNYIIVEDKTSMVYTLKGVGNKLDKQLHHEVEAKGIALPGRIKTGIRTEKSGSNPSDTAHGVDGVPLQIANVQTDVRTIAKHCKSADSE